LTKREENLAKEYKNKLLKKLKNKENGRWWWWWWWW
jgi:hypothetical protein